MKLSVALMLASLYVLAAPPAIAGTHAGTVGFLGVRNSDGLLWVRLFEGLPQDRPLCAANTTYFVIPDETSETGKRLYASLLEAEMLALPRYVVIHGKNSCTRWPDGEDIDYIEFK